MKKNSVQRLAVGGLFAALVLALTYAVKIPVPATGGYVHPGDGAVLCAGLMLGPYGAVAAGVGSALADLLGGYVIFALPTLLIKSGMALIPGLLAKQGAHGRNVLVFIIAALWMTAGYFAVEWVLFGLPAAIAAVLPNLLQGASGVVIGMLLSFVPIPAGARRRGRGGQEAH